MSSIRIRITFGRLVAGVGTVCATVKPTGAMVKRQITSAIAPMVEVPRVGGRRKNREELIVGISVSFSCVDLAYFYYVGLVTWIVFVFGKPARPRA